MAVPKRKIVKNIEEALEELTSDAVHFPEQTTEKQPVIQPLSIDLNREDLNTVVSKLNEVVEFLNKK